MKFPLHCTSLGDKMDSRVAQAAGTTIAHHLWVPRRGRVNTLAPVVAAGVAVGSLGDHPLFDRISWYLPSLQKAMPSGGAGVVALETACAMSQYQ